MIRNRLVELLQKAEKKCNDTKQCENCVGYGKGNECVNYLFADYLFANGVIVLLCKVGDTVYQTDGIRIYELEIFDVSLRKGKPYYETESIDFDDTAIGKSIFLTKEEAEAKMKAVQNESTFT